MKKEELEAKLKSFPEMLKSDDDGELAEKALCKFQQEKRIKKKFSLPKVWRAVIACALVFIIAVPVAITFWSHPEPAPKYFSSAQVEATPYSSIVDFNKEKNLNLLNLFAYQLPITCLKYTVKEDKSIAFLSEHVLVESSEEYDEIQLFAIPNKNTFEEFAVYENAKDIMEYKAVAIHYSQTVENMFFQKVYARFEYNGHRYYLKIASIDENCLIKCLQHLF